MNGSWDSPREQPDRLGKSGMVNLLIVDSTVTVDMCYRGNFPIERSKSGCGQLDVTAENSLEKVGCWNSWRVQLILPQASGSFRAEIHNLASRNTQNGVRHGMQVWVGDEVRGKISTLDTLPDRPISSLVPCVLPAEGGSCQ